jgi:hypothetical protein
MELSGATFVLIFLCGSRNKYRNTGNKYENEYFRKQIWNEYGVNTDEKWMITGTKRPAESCNKTQESQVNQKKLFPKPVKITQCNGGVEVDCFDSSI